MQPTASSTALQTTCPPTGAAATGTPIPETVTATATIAETTVTATTATAETVNVTATVTTAVGLVLRTVEDTALRPGGTMTVEVAPGAIGAVTMTRAMTGEEAPGAVTKTTTAEGAATTALLRRGITTTTGAEATVAVLLVGATRLPAVEEEEVLPVRGADAEVRRLKALASTTSATVVAVRLRKTRSPSASARDSSRRGTSSRQALRPTPPSRPR